MPAEQSRLTRDTRRAAMQILLPIGGLILAVVLIVTALVQVSTEGADTIEAGRVRARVESALAERARAMAAAASRGAAIELAEHLQSNNYDPNAVRRAIEERKRRAPIEITLDIRSRRGVESAADIARSPLANKLASASRLKGAGSPLLLSDLGDSERVAERIAHATATYALLIEPSGALTLVTGVSPTLDGAAMGGPLDLSFLALRTLESADLTEMSIEHGVPRLIVSNAAPTQTEDAVPALDLNGARIGSLIWTPDRPGETIRVHARPTMVISMIVIALLCGLVFEHVRHVAVDLAEREAKARNSALQDTLTGLPNRAYFEQRLDQELARGARSKEEGIALLFIDLDRFKEVNDTYGHDAGDQLIRETARRLSNALRGADTAARFGGDEFAVIQVGLRSIRDAESLARRLLDELRRPFELNAGAVQIGASIGIVLSPAHGREREELMRLADIALYRAKNEGKNRFAFFNEGMDEELKVREAVEHDLRVAIELDLLEVHYQPQFAPDGRTLRGVEALVRWRHPRFGMIPPSDFIWIAEERGLIGALGAYVMRRAFADAMRWPELRIAVNVSPAQFRLKGFVDDVSQIITASGILPARVELELTEGVVMEDAEAAEETLINLKSLGVSLALDDFGTGYSGLIYLRRFAFDKIKIDRSFLESLEPTGESAMIVQSIVHLGRTLGLTVCAEGVETEEQRILLMAAGCHEVQGFLMSRPVTAEAIDALVAAARERDARAA